MIIDYHQKIMEIIQNQILTMSNKEANRIAILDHLDKKEIKETIGVKNKIKTDKKPLKKSIKKGEILV